MDINDLAVRISFQSTLPARGSDNCEQPTARFRLTFQSTLPARGSDDAELCARF